MKPNYCLLSLAGIGVAAFPFLYADWKIRRLETLEISEAPTGDFITIDSIDVHYEAAGAGSPIVLIHGFGGSTYSWRFNLLPLAGSGDNKAGMCHRVYALDLPGFGYSGRTSKPVFTPTEQARCVKRFLEEVSAVEDSGGARTTPGEVTANKVRMEQRAAIIGNSLGASVALRFAIDYPGQTQCLILAAPSVFVRFPWSGLLPIFNLPILGRALARTIYYFALANEKATARMMASAYGSKIESVSDEVRTSLLRPVHVKGSADSALGLARSRDDRPLFERLREVTCPVLIVAGGQDRALPISSVERLHRTLPNSKLVVIQEAGHLVQEDAPDEFNKLAIEFIQANAG